jgi:uncharacterized membrane protein
MKNINSTLMKNINSTIKNTNSKKFQILKKIQNFHKISKLKKKNLKIQKNSKFS